MTGSLDADLDGRTCLVTGASSGIGLAAAELLAGLGARVVLGVRDLRRGRAALEAVRRAGGRDVEVALLDVASQASIRTFARDFTAACPRLDVLVNNAGIWSEKRQRSADGIELVWATNVLGYFSVTEALLPSLRAANEARVINVASRLAGGLDLSDVEFARRPYAAEPAYAQSKQANRMLTWALARRVAGTGLLANAMSPGAVATDLALKGGRRPPFWRRWLRRSKARTPREGADTVVWLAASREASGRSGAFFFDRAEIPCEFRNEADEEGLWGLCGQMTSA